MPLSPKTKLGMWIIVLVVLGYTAIEINGAVDHLTHADWDPHANFHALTGLFWLLTLFAVTLVLLRHFAKRAESWSLGAIAFVGLGVFGGAVGADPLTIHGLRQGHTALATGVIAYWSGWAALFCWAVGVLLMRSHAVKS
jgi:hypothetical protein